MRGYNGFTGKHRLQVWEVQKRMRAEGTLSWDQCPCDMCKTTEGVIMPHNENYFDVKEFYPLCVECHMILHGRFSRPKTWLQYLILLKQGYVPYGWRTPMEFFKCPDPLPLVKPILMLKKPADIGSEWYHKLPMVEPDLYTALRHIEYEITVI